MSCLQVLFIAETFGYCCVYLIIEGENLSHQLNQYPLFKTWGKPEFMCLSAVIFLPTCLLRNLSWLSYFSALGVLSSMVLLFGVISVGLMDKVPPNPDFCSEPGCSGSLYKPSHTVPIHLGNTMQMLGLVMVGFAGHAVFPTLRNDMKVRACVRACRRAAASPPAGSCFQSCTPSHARQARWFAGFMLLRSCKRGNTPHQTPGARGL